MHKQSITFNNPSQLLSSLNKLSFKDCCHCRANGYFLVHYNPSVSQKDVYVCWLGVFFGVLFFCLRNTPT